MNQKIYDKLVETARAGTVTSYSEIAPLADLDLSDPADRNRVGELLGEISILEHQKGRPMLSSVVVHKDGNTPGVGFFTLAHELGLFTGGDRDEFYARELQRTLDYWQTH